MCDMTYSCVGHVVLIFLISFIRLRYLFFCMPTNPFDRFIWIRSVTHMQVLCHTYERVISHMWRRHVTHMNESYHTCEGVMSHIWITHISLVKGSCHTNDSVMSHTWRIHVTCTKPKVTWRLRVCDMTHSYVWHHSSISVIRAVWLNCACVTWLICACVIWLICACDMTHLYVWHDSFVHVTWLTCMTDACVFLCANIWWLICAYSSWLISHVVRLICSYYSRIWLMRLPSCVQIFRDSYVHIVDDSYLMEFVTHLSLWRDLGIWLMRVFCTTQQRAEKLRTSIARAYNTWIGQRETHT